MISAWRPEFLQCPDMAETFDAVVIGSGPNGMAAAITLARAGKSVLLREGNATLGGSCRSAELTLPGFVHDICSTVQALAVASPFMRSLPLREHGLELVQPPAPYAQPMDDGTAAIAERSIHDTCATLGVDAHAYRKLMSPLVRDWEKMLPALLAPPGPFTRHPIAMMRFGLKAFRSARSIAESWFKGEHAKALFAGAAAHAILPLEWAGTAAYGLVLGTSAHAGGWPVAKGGTQKLTDALVSYFRSLGGRIESGTPVESIDELPSARAILCDMTPRQLIRIAGEKMPGGYRRRLERFVYGPGAHKVDWALSGPIPWKNPSVARAGTVHLGGTFDELANAERAPWEGRHAPRPYVLLVQASLFDPTRAPAGKHTAWAYCHVPNGSTVDATESIEAQVERFAPGFRDLILARSVMSTGDLERHNPNLIGGDITGGAQFLKQVLARPVAQLNPYRTAVKGLYLCSASTPPGAGVHGMCGYHAARTALRDNF
jgi:phytoene dehydrogenase-like protein